LQDIIDVIGHATHGAGPRLSPPDPPNSMERIIA
jgi:hypothetical protein